MGFSNPQSAGACQAIAAIGEIYGGLERSYWSFFIFCPMIPTLNSAATGWSAQEEISMMEPRLYCTLWCNFSQWLVGFLGECHAAYDSNRHLDFSPHRRATHLASQCQMGILSKWRAWPGITDCDHFNAYRWGIRLTFRLLPA